jgi:hypothetical protein
MDSWSIFLSYQALTGRTCLGHEHRTLPGTTLQYQMNSCSTAIQPQGRTLSSIPAKFRRKVARFPHHAYGWTSSIVVSATIEQETLRAASRMRSAFALWNWGGSPGKKRPMTSCAILPKGLSRCGFQTLNR